MYLKSITLKGFKSFPDRTRLDFGPGVSVIVGPNGSGKSNVTDAVLWAMGEQSPLAVRGQSMQDVIFGGGRGVQARSSAEVEIVLDNGDGTVDLPMGELSIVRRLGRDGEGEYRLNGARCRLVDVLEVLSDTGLGKEMHSVVSQGRVESIVTSKPKDRRLLIEEAAGLGKHRKRRRRAQLKLERTQDNIDRVLDVEREARSRLRPLKRQAEAAELHERLERQTSEARWALARDTALTTRTELVVAEQAATSARELRDEAQARLGEVTARRHQAEEALAQRTAQREAIAQRAFAARSAAERVSLRLERTRETGDVVAERIANRERQLAALRAQSDEDSPDAAGLERIEALEAELTRLDADREAEVARELEQLERERGVAAARSAEVAEDVAARRAELLAAEELAETARTAMRAAETAAEAARREASRVGAELAASRQFLRTHAGGLRGAASLADELEVEPGLEHAVAAVLRDRLGAALAGDLAEGHALLDAAGEDGGRVLISGGDAPASASPGTPPLPSARAMADVVSGPARAVAAARRALAGAWLVERLDTLPQGFDGVAVTRDGRVWIAGQSELRQAPRGGEERILAERNRREALIAESEHAVAAEQAALAAVEASSVAVAAAATASDEAGRAVREADRAQTAAAEDERRIGWTIEQRRQAPAEGASAVRRAQVEGELAAERRVAERAARERRERAERITFLGTRLAADRALVPHAQALAAALESAGTAIAQRLELLDAELESDRAAGEGVSERLRACAADEAEIQGSLRERGDMVTATEVRAQQLRDQAAEAQQELDEVAQRLGFEAGPADEPLVADDVAQLRERIERLLRRREQLGPVNPLAKAEYDEAIAHVEELERQRTDLEVALRELRTLIRDTDRQIRESFEQTFAAAAENFERIAAELFPGGRGRLRLVREDAGPRLVLGGAASGDGVAEVEAEQAAEDAADAEAEPDGPMAGPDDDLGVEIEITPAGKSMKRLTLLSGGEKSMTAIAFLFSVFLARPCPFYILDEVEAALDDLNITRFLNLLERHADQAQFIVVTHQRRTMEAADTLYGVSMGDDGVSKVVSRKLPRDAAASTAPAEAAGPAPERLAG
ncbi:MAG TPA: AAA family ATPase [Solirubrobacteraceae bacterium]|nr:AAA family ATPase [Solirubrobacteraceae bacterium]